MWTNPNGEYLRVGGGWRPLDHISGWILGYEKHHLVWRVTWRLGGDGLVDGANGVACVDLLTTSKVDLLQLLQEMLPLQQLHSADLNSNREGILHHCDAVFLFVLLFK